MSDTKSSVVVNDDKMIRVSANGKRRNTILGLFGGKSNKDDSTTGNKDDKTYERESLKGRNPVDFEAQLRKVQEEKEAAAAKAKTANASRGAPPPPPPQKTTPPATSNTSNNRTSSSSNPRRASEPPPVTFPNRTRSSPLDGRNPVDFGKANGYGGGKNQSKARSTTAADNSSDSLAGRNPRDFDNCDPYGNPIGTPSRDSLAGRNPQDFDGVVVPCDPYGNPIVVDTKEEEENPLAGRNPVDFDPVEVEQQLEAHNSHHTTASRDNTYFVNGVDECLHCPHCQARLQREKDEAAAARRRQREEEDRLRRLAAEEQARRDEEERLPKEAEECRKCQRCQAPLQNVEDDEAAAAREKEEEEEKERLAKEAAAAAEKERLARIQTEEDEAEQANNNKFGSKLVHLDGPADRDKEQVDLEHVETTRREIQKEVPVWAKVKLKQTQRGSVIKKKKVPPSEREKFSLPTYHQPRQSVTD